MSSSDAAGRKTSSQQSTQSNHPRCIDFESQSRDDVFSEVAESASELPESASELAESASELPESASELAESASELAEPASESSQPQGSEQTEQTVDVHGEYHVATVKPRAHAQGREETVIEVEPEDEEYHERVMAKARETFRRLDHLKDGTIATRDLGQALREAGIEIGEADLRAYLEEVDFYGEGKISMETFLAIVSEKLEARSVDAEILAILTEFDTQKSGRIGRQALKNILTKRWTPSQDREAKLTCDMFEEMMDDIGYHDVQQIDYREMLKRLRAINDGTEYW